MKCKWDNSYRQRKKIHVLIEAKWNVNLHDTDLTTISKNVLIEAKWNVNFTLEEMAESFNTVLIEAKWNVN